MGANACKQNTLMLCSFYMERHALSITKNKETYNFEISDYPHHQHDHCKFDIYRDGVFVAGFNPDEQHVLHLCRNEGIVPEDVLHLLADKIEAHHWV